MNSKGLEHQSSEAMPSHLQRRRHLLGGLVAATAVATIPQQWTQPVLSRIIAPAHGQAVSIAAGVYTVDLNFDLTDMGDSYPVTLRVVFGWPGGVDPGVVFAPTVVSSDFDSESIECLSDGNPFGARIRVGLPADRKMDEIVSSNEDPALPGGLVFLVEPLDAPCEFPS